MKYSRNLLALFLRHEKVGCITNRVFVFEVNSPQQLSKVLMVKVDLIALGMVGDTTIFMVQ